MSLKTGCYQDLSIGGLTVMILTHVEYEDLKRKGRWCFSGGHVEPYDAPKDTPMNKWVALSQSQEQRYLDRRMDS